MMKKNWELGMKIAKIVLVTAAVYLGMKYVFWTALPFLSAFFFARLLYPLAVKLETKAGLKREMARFAAYGVFWRLLPRFLLACYMDVTVWAVTVWTIWKVFGKMHISFSTVAVNVWKK